MSSPEAPAWYVYDVGEDGDLLNRRLFMDARPMKEVCVCDKTTASRVTMTLLLRERARAHGCSRL